MNIYGAYTRLLGNSIEAVSAAIEIYNKPRIAYREECSIILLVNGWELLLKALLSKNKKRLYYKKKPSEAYRSLSIRDCLLRAEAHFPATVEFKPTSSNLSLLIDYRDQAIHYYNSAGLRVLLYGLAQTCIVNFRDLVLDVFARDITKEITLSLLPLSIAQPVDPIEFVKQPPRGKDKAVAEFSAAIRELVAEVERAGGDTGRLMTNFDVHLISTKKIASADLVVGVNAAAGAGAPLLVQRNTDPNVTHPYREVDIVGRPNDPQKVGMEIHAGGIPLGQYQFRAVVFHYRVKENERWCWTDATGAVTRYSPAFVEFVKRLNEAELKEALKAFKKRLYG